MTAARQQRKSPLALGQALGLTFGLAVCGGIFASPAILAAPSDRIVVDAHSGLAISGFDPVAVARGNSVPGHPPVLGSDRRAALSHLFYSTEPRAAFLAERGRIIERAMRKWPEVARTIAC
jgi:hypothetical protein